MRLDKMSPNLIKIINRTLYNVDKSVESEKQIVSQLIKYKEVNPYSMPLVTQAEAKSLFMQDVFPYPKDSFTDEAKTEVRIYYPDCEFENDGVIEDTRIVFDILVHESLYLIKNKNNESQFRPVEIAKYIVNFFDNYNFDTVGKLHFERMLNLPFDNGFQGTRLIARMTTIGV